MVRTQERPGLSCIVAAGLMFVIRFASNTCDAQAGETPDEELTAARLLTEPTDTMEPPVLRPQLVHHDTATPVVTGVATGVIGIGTLAASWAVYVGRQSYRLQPRSRLDAAVVDGFESRGAWAFWLSVGAATHLTAAEYLLLPEAQGVPTLAWFAGGVGVITATIGLAFTAGSEHCAPQSYHAGADVLRTCQSSTSDALFGPTLMLTAIPFLNVPVTYLLRSAFAGSESLSLAPTGVTYRASF